MTRQEPFPDAWKSCVAWWATQGIAPPFKWLFGDRITNYKRIGWFLDSSAASDQKDHEEFYERGRSLSHSLSICFYGRANGFGLIGVEVPDLIIPEAERCSGGNLDFKVHTSPFEWRPVRMRALFSMLRAINRFRGLDDLSRHSGLPNKIQQSGPENPIPSGTSDAKASGLPDSRGL